MLRHLHEFCQNSEMVFSKDEKRFRITRTFSQQLNTPADIKLVPAHPSCIENQQGILRQKRTNDSKKGKEIVKETSK